MGAGASSFDTQLPFPDKEAAIAGGKTEDDITKWCDEHKIAALPSNDPVTVVPGKQAEEAPAAGEEVQEVIMDWNFALIQCGAEADSGIDELKETKVFVDEIIGDYTGEVKKCLEGITKAFQDKGPSHAVQHAAHTIKGSGVNVGAKRLSSLGKVLEMHCKAKGKDADFFVEGGVGDVMQKNMAAAFVDFQKKISDDAAIDEETLFKTWGFLEKTAVAVAEVVST